MLETILGILAIVELFITLGVTFYIAGKSELEYNDRHNFILSALGDFLKKLFVDKNWFGISLGVIIFILIIPAILLLLFGEAVGWLIFLVVMIWELGNKNNN